MPTYTYDMATDVGLVRMMIGDTDFAEDQGRKPDGANFSDEEIQALIARAGGNWQRGLILTLEVLANLWGLRADISAGTYRETCLATARSIETRIEHLQQRLPDLWAGTISHG
jgi:hypothetical protein